MPAHMDNMYNKNNLRKQWNPHGRDRRLNFQDENFFRTYPMCAAPQSRASAICNRAAGQMRVTGTSPDACAGAGTRLRQDGEGMRPCACRAASPRT